MSLADTNAVVALIKTAGALSSSVWVTKVPDGPTRPARPYVLVHPHAGNDQQTRAGSGSATETPDFTLHIVGDSATSVQTVLELVKPKFVTAGVMVPPTISGRSNKQGYWRSPLPIQADTDVTPSLLFAIVELGWVSDPT